MFIFDAPKLIRAKEPEGSNSSSGASFPKRVGTFAKVTLRELLEDNPFEIVRRDEILGAAYMERLLSQTANIILWNELRKAAVEFAREGLSPGQPLEDSKVQAIIKDGLAIPFCEGIITQDDMISLLSCPAQLTEIAEKVEALCLAGHCPEWVCYVETDSSPESALDITDSSPESALDIDDLKISPSQPILTEEQYLASRSEFAELSIEWWLIDLTCPKTFNPNDVSAMVRLLVTCVCQDGALRDHLNLIETQEFVRTAKDPHFSLPRDQFSESVLQKILDEGITWMKPEAIFRLLMNPGALARIKIWVTHKLPDRWLDIMECLGRETLEEGNLE